MRPVKRPDPEAVKAGPSRAAYRLRRAWAQAWVRTAVTVYLPLTLLGLVAWGIVSTDRLRLAIQAEVAGVLSNIAERPEFTVRGVDIRGGTPDLRDEIIEMTAHYAGQSSLRLDLGALRDEVEGLGWVASASVFFDPSGMLRIKVSERVPAAVWRDPDTTLWVLDAEGVVIAATEKRLDYPALPLLIGLGAPQKLADVRQLMAAAPALMPRIRAFARVGKRRWSLVLDREMVVMLPAEGPVKALKGIMALQFGEEVFARDLAVIDLRIPHRPTLRLAPQAAEALVLRRAVELVLGEDT
ncbi:MAG: cell division protein FtsQ/DivIB [Pseudomonadota bacterium]